MTMARARKIGQERGSVTLEYVLVAVPMILLAFGVAELGRAIVQYNTLAKATRDAARYLTMFQPGTRTAAAACLAVSGNVSVNAAGSATCLGTALLPGLSAGNVTICEATSCPATHRNVTLTGVGPVNLVTVTIQSYAFATLVPAVIPDITFGPISTTMRAPL